MAKSRARFLAELLGTDGLVKKAKSALAGADEVIDLSALPSIPNSKLTNSSITINSSATSLGGSVTLTTANVAENTNLYYTDARADARITAADTGDLSEGSNLYYTDARADARVNLQTGSNLNLSSKDTGDLSEGSNLYYTDARADARIAAASTSDLSEGSNLYYTDARADARVALVVDSAPSTLNTLNELAAALGDDANFSTTVTNSIAAKLPLAGGTMSGALNMGANAITSTGTISSGAITSSGNIAITAGSGQRYIEMGSGTSGAKTYRIYNGIAWNPDALLIYNHTDDSTVLTIEPGKLGINKGASSLSHTLDVGGNVAISGTEIISSARNLTSIGTISSGAITSSGKVQAAYLKATSNIPSETAANRAYLDFFDGDTRIISKGPDGSTLGGFKIVQQAKDGSPSAASFVIDTSSNATFAGTISSGAITSTGLNSTSGTVQYTDGGSAFDSSDASGYPRFTVTNGSAQLGLFRGGSSAGGSYIGADDSKLLRVYNSSFASKFDIDTSGNVTTLGTISSGAITSTGTLTLPGGTNGSRTIKDSYTSGSLANQGTIRSSGGNYWGYGTYQDGSANWKSSVSVAAERSVYAIDEDTAYWSHAASQTVSIGSDLTTQPTKKIVFDLQNTKVGIGDTSPDWKFTVEGSVADDWISRIYNTATNGAGLLVRTDATAANDKIAFAVYSDSGYKMSVRSTGKVGIGTTAPQAPLEINGGAGMTGGWGRSMVLRHAFPVLVFQSEYSTDTYSGIGYDNSTGLKFFVNTPTIDVTANSAVPALTILDSHKVGIGTANPSSKLHVYNGESGAPAPLADSVLILENNTHNYLQFLTPSSSESGLIFGDVQNDNTAGITYSHSTDNLSIISADDIVLSSDTVIVGNNKPIWSGSYGGALFLKGNNATSDRYAQLSIVNSSGTLLYDGLVVNNVGNVGIGTQSPFSRLQSGGHTFSGGHGMHADARVGISNHGSLTGMMLASTYNDASHPEYGLVFVQGPTTSNYNVWSISPDGPAKGDSLNFHYQAQSTNIHSPGNVKVTFDGNGNVGIGETVPQTKLHVKSGDSGGGVYNTSYNPLVIETATHGGLQILTPNNKNGLIYFGDNDNAVIGRIEYKHADNDMIFITAANQKASVSAGGALMMTPGGMSSHNGAVYIIGSVSNYSTANGRYFHVQLSTVGNHMFHIFVEGYVYTTGYRHGRCSGYVYNYAAGTNGATGSGSQPGVYDGRVSDNIVAMYSNQNNARIELVIDTGNTGTGNRWGSFSIYGGVDHITAYTPIEVVQYTTSNTAGTRQFSS